MREVLTVSLPSGTKKVWKERAKNRGFKSVSEYINFLFIQEDDLISADDILKAGDEADKQYKDGTLTSAKSLVDLYGSK